MELSVVILVGVIFAVLGLACIALIVLGLPGAWIILAMAVVVNLLDSLYLAEGRADTFNWWVLGVCLVLAGLGELFELLAGAMGAKAGGSTRRGTWGALLGGLIGGVLGIFIPAPIVGSLIGAVIGTFVGAVVGELSGQAQSNVRVTLRPATGATIGRILGTVSKLPIALVIWIVLTVDAFWR